MFEHFNEHARRVVVLAQAEAVRAGQTHIGTDQLLLGILTHPDGAGFRLVGQLGISPAELADQVRQKTVHGPGAPDHVPFAPEAKKALEFALREALRLKDRYVGSEHVLLAVLKEGSGEGARMLLERGIGVTEAESHLGDIAREAPLSDGVEPKARWWRRRGR